MDLNIKRTVFKEDWEVLVNNFLPAAIADSYSFDDAMRIVGRLLNFANYEIESTDPQVDFVRDYCTNLMIILRAKFPQEWIKDWKNEAFLGIACRFVYREEEGFRYIQNAFLQLDDPPQSLILSYISAGQTSDHFLSLETIKALSQKATAKGITFEVALNMASLAYTEGKEAEKQYWKEKANIAEKNRSHTAIIIPNILKGICKIREGCFYEK